MKLRLNTPILGHLIIIIIIIITTAQSSSLNDNGHKWIRDSMEFLEKTAKNSNDFYCDLCEITLAGVRSLIDQNISVEIVDSYITSMCKTIGLTNDYVCAKIPLAFNDEIRNVLLNTRMTTREMCAIFLTEGCHLNPNDTAIHWQVRLPGKKPPVQPWTMPPRDAPKFRVLHLSDIHVDRQYETGSEADCLLPRMSSKLILCCRHYPNETHKMVKNPAGYWGMVGQCDIPFRTFTNALEHISRTEKQLAYIIITGDMVSHDAWLYTRKRTVDNLRNITRVLRQYFPYTPIYQAIGNHEAVPQDGMAPHSIDHYDKMGPQWLYETVSELWSDSKMLPQSTVPQIKYRASYSFRPYVGLKIISLNTVYCSKWNFFLYKNDQNPDDTLMWLINELYESEQAKEKVHIIAHIPNGVTYCMKGWSHNYYKIVYRFESTIAAQFFGHTHYDHFEVYYENDNPNGRPFHVNLISPSLTTETNNQPSYRIYTIDGYYPGSNFTVLDAETYSTNVTQANIDNANLEWKLEYRTKDAYQMPDLLPQSWSNLIDRMKFDEKLFGKFLRFYHRTDEKGISCDTVCKNNYLCALRTAKSYENRSVFCSDL